MRNDEIEYNGRRGRHEPITMRNMQRELHSIGKIMRVLINLRRRYYRV
jgi:hypothetical protein